MKTRHVWCSEMFYFQSYPSYGSADVNGYSTFTVQCRQTATWAQQSCCRHSDGWPTMTRPAVDLTRHRTGECSSGAVGGSSQYCCVIFLHPQKGLQ